MRRRRDDTLSSEVETASAPAVFCPAHGLQGVSVIRSYQAINRILRQQSLAWGALVIGLGITLIATNNTRHQMEDEAADSFAFAADQVLLRIEERLLSYALLLRGAAGLFHSSTEVTRDDWRSYVDNLRLDENLVGVQGIGFSQLVRPEELSAHQETIQAQGFPDYGIYPGGERSLYTSIVYLEPFAGRNLVAFGYDMYSEAVRRTAMERARDENDASMSGRVQLVQETDTDVQAGTLIYVPVYANGADISTPEQRREALIGWAYSPFRMTDLMNGIVGDWSRVNMDAIGLRIYDNGIASADNLMFVSPGLQNEAHEHRPHQSRLLDIHGQRWLLEFEPLTDTLTPDAYAPVRRTAVAGVLLTLLLFALLMSMSRTRHRAETIAHKLTQDMRSNETALRAANAEAERFRDALDAVTSYIYIKDGERRYVYANQICLDLFQRTLDTLPGSRDDDFFPPESCEQIRQADERVLAGEKTRIEVEVPAADGSRRVYLEVKSPVYDHDDPERVIGILGISTDITALKDNEAAMQRIAHFDALTGLPNRLLLSDRLYQGMVRANRRSSLMAVVYLDLDGFKAVNDKYGHDAGDDLLRTVATRMLEAVREGDTVARIGGDEFVIILQDFSDIDQLTPILARLMDACSQAFTIANDPVRVSASLGVRVYNPADTSDSQPTEDRLLREADQAMYQAKTSGRRRVCLFVSHGPAICILEQDARNTRL